MIEVAPSRQGVRLLAVGDIKVERDDPETAFGPGMAVLGEADILFGNCEAVYADTVSRAPSASIPVLCKPEHAAGLGYAGFDIMSMANNHTVDGGHEALAETMAQLDRHGILTCGAGADIEEARAARYLERDGRTFAFLAYSCVYPAGYEAREGIPGLAAIRTHTLYFASEMDAYQSGGLPDSATVVNPADLRTVTREIKAARTKADVVVVSVHAGDGSRPAVVLDYERQLARAAVDAGADVYLGHHHHMLRGAEVHHGKPIFYGLGHYVFDIPDFDSQVPPSIMARMKEHAGEYGYGHRDGWPLLPMHPDARMTMIAVLDVETDGAVRAGIVPTMLNPEGQAVPVRLDSPDGRQIAEYMTWMNTEAELDGAWARGPREVGGFEVLELVAADATTGAHR